MEKEKELQRRLALEFELNILRDIGFYLNTHHHITEKMLEHIKDYHIGAKQDYLLEVIKEVNEFVNNYMRKKYIRQKVDGEIIYLLDEGTVWE